MTVRQLLGNIDARELSEWRAYFQIERELIDNGGKTKQTLEEKLRAGLRGK